MSLSDEYAGEFVVSYALYTCDMVRNRESRRVGATLIIRFGRGNTCLSTCAMVLLQDNTRNSYKQGDVPAVNFRSLLFTVLGN